MSPAAPGSSRDETIRKARAGGATLRQIGEEVGLSREMVRLILKGPTKPDPTPRSKSQSKDKLTDPDELAIAAWLSDLHEEIGGNRSKLARDIGTDRKNIYRWLDAEAHPGGATLLKLLDAFHVRLTPKPPEEIARPLNVELADVRSVVEALVDVVDEIQAELQGLASLVRSQHEAPGQPRAKRRSAP